jgi:hypothetical protein
MGRVPASLVEADALVCLDKHRLPHISDGNLNLERQLVWAGRKHVTKKGPLSSIQQAVQTFQLIGQQMASLHITSQEVQFREGVASDDLNS